MTAKSDFPFTRRSFLQAAGALAAGAVAARSGLSADTEAKADPAPAMQVGLLLGTISRPTLAERLDAAKGCGLDCVQLNLGCMGLPMMPDAIPAEAARQAARAARERGVPIVSLEGTFNMSHPDPAHRADGLRRLRVMAEAGAHFSVSILHCCTGTRDPDNMWRRHPDNGTPEAWRDLVSTFRAAAAMAEETGVVLAFEPEVNNVVDSAEKARRLIDEVGSPRVKVCIDAANIFHAGELPRMDEILDRAFELVGKDIVLAHAKDLSHDGDAGHEPAGHGKLNYDRYIALLHRTGFRGPLLLHGLSEAQIPECAEFLREKMAKAG